MCLTNQPLYDNNILKIFNRLLQFGICGLKKCDLMHGFVIGWEEFRKENKGWVRIELDWEINLDFVGEMVGFVLY